jgi:flagellar operon protein
VRFSAHAQTRLQSRQIALEAGHLDRLQGAVQRAASKGARDALVLMDDLAMVVSVVNRTVVTVVDRDNLKQNVFTNIDSAVIA